eukprot:591580-Amphidinium_carterae.1
MLPCFKKLSRQFPELVAVTLDPCMFGLTDAEGKLLKRSTTLLTNLPGVEKLHRHCNHEHDHGHMVGGMSSGQSQVWPVSLCRSIAELVMRAVHSDPKHVCIADVVEFGCYPGSLSEGQSSGYRQCPGCRGHKSALDPSHTRKAGECRWSDMSEAAVRARAFVPRSSHGRVNVLRDARHEVPLSSAQGEVLNLDTEQRSHAGGSVAAPGVADEVVEGDVSEVAAGSDEAAVDAAIRKLLVEADGIDEYIRKQRDAETQATSPDEVPDWSAWDLKRVAKWLQQPMSVSRIRAVLRRLHVRWWHCSAERMLGILRTCGVTESVLAEVRGVCDSCAICRKWHKPNPKPRTTSRLSTAFNETVQLDILYIERKPVVHMIDEATRFSVAAFVPRVEDQSLMQVLGHDWLRMFGAPKTLVSDQEGGIMSDWSGVQLGRWGISRMPLPERSHASVVERHHAIIRDTFVRVRDQCVSDGVPYTDSLVLDESVFAKNVLTNIGGFSPYQAVFGRTPPLMITDFEQAPLETLRDDGETSLGQTARIRELAVACMTESLATDRVKRAMKAQTHRSSKEMNLEIGQLVDFYRTPVGKERPGWRGPARIVDASTVHDNGILHVLWQGRVLSVSATDVRPHLVLLTMLSLESFIHATVISFVEAQLDGKPVVFAFVPVRGRGQVPTRAIRENSQIWNMLCDIGSLDLGLGKPSMVVLGRGLKNLPGVPGCGSSLMLSWHVGRGDQHLEHELDGSRRQSLKELLGDTWPHQCVVEFLTRIPGATDDEDVTDAAKTGVGQTGVDEAQEHQDE